MYTTAKAADPARASIRSMNDANERVDVANALNVIRPTLGDTAGVALYRLLRLVALEDIIGRGAAGTAYVAGKKLGNSLGLTTLDQFLELCTALKIGVIEVPVITESRIHVDVYECITCSGLQTVGRTLCQLDDGESPRLAGRRKASSGLHTKKGRGRAAALSSLVPAP